LILSRGIAVAFLLLLAQISSESANVEDPLFRVVDLAVGESAEVELSNGKKARIKLLDLEETRDEVCAAVRRAQVKVEVNGQTITLVSATYHLPITVAGMQIDCPITKGYNQDSRTDAWGLVKDARLRIWPAGASWMPPGTFRYPARQRWFATMTQMANEPVYVDGGDVPGPRKIYYHYGLDIGGSEGLVEVIAATDGLVVSAGKEMLPEHKGTPVDPRYDVVYVLDSRGWYHRYSHLKTIDVKLGEQIKIGRKIGLLGKEGGSGGWSHLHFDIHSRQPSGKWGIQEGYAFLWEAYLREYQPRLLAVARPHHVIWATQKVTLDATRSWAKGPRYEWTFTDGSRATGAQVERKYEKPGSYSEILKVTDADGRVDYDFAIVQVIDKANLNPLPPTIHPNYAPTFGIKPGDPVTFKVRTFRTQDGEEQWDFGDGTPIVKVKSDGNVKPLAPDGYAETVHRFERPGLYVVRVERSNKEGVRAVGHLKIRIGDEPR
jgi:murein DD-endopeptidase MepM/ murein hydrolase activator NlpD